MNTKEVLIAAKALIDTPEKWTQGWYARDARGERTSDRGSDATCFCAIGAMWRAGQNIKQADLACRALASVIGNNDGIAGQTVSDWNDAPSRTHAEVMAAFDRAIEAAS